MSFATLKNSIEKYKQKLDQDTQDKLNVIGAWAVTEANNNITSNNSIVTSNLKNSINYATADMQSDISDTDGQPLEQPDKGIVKVGTTVEYARRVELGFIGQDSLGRNYNQPAKPYLRPIFKMKNRIIKLFTGN